MTENKEQWEFSLEELCEATPVNPGVEALAKHFAERAEQTMNSVLEQKLSSLSEPAGKAKGIYFSKEAAKYLKHVIDCGTIVDSKEDKEIIDPKGVIPGYIEPGWPYFGKPIKFIGTNPKVSTLDSERKER